MKKHGISISRKDYLLFAKWEYGSIKSAYKSLSRDTQKHPFLTSFVILPCNLKREAQLKSQLIITIVAGLKARIYKSLYSVNIEVF